MGELRDPGSAPGKSGETSPVSGPTPATWTPLDNLDQSRQGDRSGHWRITCSAQEEDLPVWQDVQGFGIVYFSVIAGVMNRKVCACTNVFGGPSDSICGM